MDRSLVNDIVKKAEELVDRGSCKKALLLLQPLIEEGIPEAIFLYSKFSIASSETIDEFERRSLDMLTRAAEAGYAPAIYSLACCYETGDIVGVNSERSSELFKRGADLGHPGSMYRHGLNLFYGSNGIHMDRILSLNLIQGASAAGVEEANEFLSIYKFGDYSTPGPR